MSEKNNHQYFTERHRHIKTAIGQWLAGRDAILRGKSILNELIYELTESQLLIFGISGKIIEKRLADWIEKTRFIMSYPDSRLWCNQVAALAASQGASPVTADTLGMLAADSRAYGSFVQRRIVEAVEQLYQAYESTPNFEELANLFPKTDAGYAIPGFLRPIKAYDERLDPMRKITAQLEFEPGPRLRFVEAFSEFLEQRFQLGLNSAGYCCAFLMDNGLTADDVYLLSASRVEIGVLACYQAFSDRPENGFLPLQCEDVEYQGSAIRTLEQQ